MAINSKSFAKTTLLLTSSTGATATTSSRTRSAARRYIGLLERIVGDEFARAVREHGIVPARSLQGSK